MKKRIIGFLKIIIPLGIGVFFIWIFMNGLSEEGKIQIKDAFSRANYSWILFSLVFAVLSHMSRAYRWSYALSPLGYKPKFWNNFFSVMIGYFVNLIVPRLGEFTRCGVMSKYEKIPFDKLLGTVIAERIADLIILILIIISVVFIQMDVIGGLINEIFSKLTDKFSVELVVTVLLGFAVMVGATLFVFFNKSFQYPIILKIRKIILGILEGVTSILKMEKKWEFIGHTIFIWVMYLFMFYVCFYSLNEVSSVPFGGVLTAFVLGGITIVIVNGGIGIYPLAIQGVLLLYGVDGNIGVAFGWIVWTAQTLLLLVLGALSFALMPLYNKRFGKPQLA